MQPEEEEEKLTFVPHLVFLRKHGCAQKARGGLDVLFCGGKEAERQEQNKGEQPARREMEATLDVLRVLFKKAFVKVSLCNHGKKAM